MRASPIKFRLSGDKAPTLAAALSAAGFGIASSETTAHIIGTASQTTFKGLGGDLTGVTAAKLQSRPVASTAPSDGQVLMWDETGSTWEPASIPDGVTDHGALTGLSDDDHAQYSLASGARWTTTQTIDRAVMSNGSGHLVVSSVTSTELGYLSGVTSAIQTQLDGKALQEHQHSIADTEFLQAALDSKQASDAALTALAAGSDFVQFTGPATTTKVFTLPDSTTRIVTAPSALTSTRVPFANANGELTDSVGLVFNDANRLLTLTQTATTTAQGAILGNVYIGSVGINNNFYGLRPASYRTSTSGWEGFSIQGGYTIIGYTAGNYLALYMTSTQVAGWGGTGVFTQYYGAVINENGGTGSVNDFRVETDTNTHMLYVDATNNRMSIGAVTNGGYTLQVNGTMMVSNGIIYLVDTNNYIWNASGSIYLRSGGSVIIYGNGTNQALFGVSGSAIFNEQGNAVDFRVESDTQTHMLYVDGTNNRMSIGAVTNGGYTLQVNGTMQVTSLLRLNNGTTSIEFGYGSGIAQCGTSTNHDFRFITYDTDRGRITSTGQLVWGASSADAAAKFQIDSTTQGMLPPRHTTVQRAAVASPPEGLFVHDTDLYHPYVRSNGTWKQVALTVDRAFGGSAYVSYPASSYAFGDFQSITAHEIGFGIPGAGYINPHFVLREYGTYHYPDDGLSVTDDRWTQGVTATAYTVDSTATVLCPNRNSYDGIPIPANCAACFTGSVTGINASSGNTVGYQIKGLVKNLAGTLTLLGDVVTVVHEEDAACNCTLAVNSATDCLEVTVVGHATEQMKWCAEVRFPFVTDDTYFP